MNTSSKFWDLFRSGLLVFWVVCSGCGDRSMNSSGDLLQASEVENIIWTMDRSGYEPVRLIFNETQFYGYDGCNWFGGRYTTRNDTIFPSDFGQTQRGCEVRILPIGYLAGPFRLRIAGNELRIFAQEGNFTFKSDVTEGVENSPLIRHWVLTASTDPEFSDIQAQKLIPVLYFTENRGFKITWACAPENGFGCDEIFGIFGIGTEGRILFYETGWQTHAPGSGFVERILGSSSYAVRAGTAPVLTLFNKNTGSKFEFEPVRESGG